MSANNILIKKLQSGASFCHVIYAARYYVIRGRVAVLLVIEHFLHPSVGLCVCLSVCPVHCGKKADRLRMRFGMIGRISQVMRQVVGFWGSVHGRG